MIGVSVGLSGEGIAPLGIDIQRGVELGLDEHPTVTIEGVEFTIRLDVQDSQCNAEGGVAVANRFSSDPAIVGVIGPMCSSACLPASNIYDAAGYSFITPSCTAAVLSRRGSTSFNRVVSPDDVEGKHTADYIYDTLGVRRVATIHDGSPYAEGLVVLFQRTIRSAGRRNRRGGCGHRRRYQLPIPVERNRRSRSRVDLFPRLPGRSGSPRPTAL